MIFLALLASAGILGGAIAAISGFGIGSVVTPVLAIRTGTKLAVAAVSIPHFLGTAVRFWRLRRHIDRAVFLSFGITSAAGGLAGALLHAWANSPALTAVFGGLLVFAGVTGLTGVSQKMRFGRTVGFIAGAVS